MQIDVRSGEVLTTDTDLAVLFCFEGTTLPESLTSRFQ